MFRCSASLAIPHRARVSPRCSLSPWCSLGGKRIAAFRCRTNHSVKLLLFRHFQDRFLTTNREKWAKTTGLCFAEFGERLRTGLGQQDRESPRGKSSSESISKLSFCDLVLITRCLLAFRGPFASHDSNPYPNCNQITRYHATKLEAHRGRKPRKSLERVFRAV